MFWLSITPLISWHGVYEGPKVLWYLVGGVVLILYWAFKILWKKESFNFSKADRFFLFWLFVLFISSIFGVHSYESIVGGSYRKQGVIFFLIFWLILKSIEELKTGKKKVFLKFIAISILGESTLVIYQMVTGQLYFGKPLGTIGEANAVAGFLSIGLVFMYMLFPKILTLIPIISSILISSRAGLLALSANIFGFINNFEIKHKKIVYSLIAVAVTVAIVFLSLNRNISPFENRLLIWKLGTGQIGKRPILGYGAESGEVVYNLAFKNCNLPLYNLMVDRSHNLIIDITMWSGFVGLLLFSLWIYHSFRETKSIVNKFAIGSFLIYSMLQPLSIVHWILLAFILKLDGINK